MTNYEMFGIDGAEFCRPVRACSAVVTTELSLSLSGDERRLLEVNPH